MFHFNAISMEMASRSKRRPSEEGNDTSTTSTDVSPTIKKMRKAQREDVALRVALELIKATREDVSRVSKDVASGIIAPGKMLPRRKQLQMNCSKRKQQRKQRNKRK